MSLSKIVARYLIIPLALIFKVDKYLLFKKNKSCCIINFHGVSKSNPDVFNKRHMHVTEFEKVIIYLKKNYDIVSISELFEIHRSKRKVIKKTIALTFDDGYANNFDVAFPILKKHHIPATFYIISKSLTQENYLVWPDIVDIIKKNHKKDIELNGHLFKYPYFNNESLKLDLAAFLKTLGDKTEEVAYDLLGRFNYQIEEIKNHPELILLVNRKNITKFVNEPLIEFGSHSHSHFNMGLINKNLAEQELKNSKEIIENVIGKKIINFAFPDGSYLPETVQAAKNIGYKNIAAVEYRHNENNSDLNLLARFPISNSTTYKSNALRLAKEFDTYGFN